MTPVRTKKMADRFWTATMLLMWACPCLSGNVLIIHPVYTGSHVLTLRTVAENLAIRGHKVTVVHWKDSHPELPRLHENVTDMVLTVDNQAGWLPFLTKETEARFEVPAGVLWDWGLKPVVFPVTGFLLLDAHCRALLSNAQLLHYLREQEYDVALVDLLYNECSLALMHNLGVPSVGYWAFSLSTGEADVTTAPLPASHIPMITSTLSDRMNFFQRVYNYMLKFASMSVMVVHNHVIDRVVQKYFPGTPSPLQLVADINGLLINTDFSFDYPRALPPTFINVGGLQIRKPRPLPPDLAEFIEGSGQAGVVLFTMGYIFHSSVVPDTMVKAFMDAFARLPQRVIIKFDVPFNNTPPNTRIYDFVPQQDVLAHPKTRAFLTHCGMHGMMETIYYGVPVVGMPIFLDQGDTLQRAVDKGIGVGISKDSDAEEIYQALRKVLRNPKYKRNVMYMSQLMRDNMSNMPPKDRAIWLLEYVMRHKGAGHLRLASRHLNLIQYFGLDVIAFLLAVAILTIYLMYTLLRWCFTHNKNLHKMSSDNYANVLPHAKAE